MQHLPLPYFDERQVPVDTLVLHCLSYDMNRQIQVCHDEQVSSHYIIDERGKIYQLVDEKYCAWHAGKSYWRGVESLNKHSIGIDLYSKSLGQQPYNKHQIQSLIRLCHRIIRQYHIKPQNIVGHSDIAPARKPDPGKAFPWTYLARNGIGLWYNIQDAQRVEESDISKMLQTIGYDISNLTAAKWAFCRHFISDIVPVENNIRKLVDSPYPTDAEIDEDKFLMILKAVYYKAQKL